MDVSFAVKFSRGQPISPAICGPTRVNSRTNANTVRDRFQFLLIFNDTLGIFTTKKNRSNALFVRGVLDNKPILTGILRSMKLVLTLQRSLTVLSQ